MRLSQRGECVLIQALLFLCSSVLHALTASTSTALTKATTTSPSSLLLCTADGKFYSMDAWTGISRAEVVSTQPLIARNRSTREGSTTESLLLPGLDGRLYWQDPDSTIQELPLTMQSLLENPVQSCNGDAEMKDEMSEENGACGILTATVETSLYALDEAGGLLWSRESATTTKGPASAMPVESSSLAPLLLQRKDFHVHYVSSLSGTELWNVSLGTWQALDFEYDNEVDLEDNDRLLPDHAEDSCDVNNRLTKCPDNIMVSTSPLPLLVFSNAGRTLEAVHPESYKVLWRLKLKSIVASVFGMYKGRWRPVHVITEEQEKTTQPLLLQPPLFPEISDHEDDQEVIDVTFDNTVDNLLERGWLRQFALQSAHQSSQPNLRRELPSPTPIPVTVPTRNKGGRVNQKQMLLQLPAPTVAPIASLDGTSTQHNGLLLSWTTVCTVIIILVTAFLCMMAWIWQKLKESTTNATNTTCLEESTAMNQCLLPPRLTQSDLILSTPSLSTTTSLEFVCRKFGELMTDQRLTRSVSLPFKLDGTKTLLFPAAVEKCFNNDRSSLAVSNVDKMRRLTMNAASSQKNETAIASTIVPFVSGIPLVRYSRYSSEFKEVEALGKGGFGTVFKCQNVLDGREYAVKKVSIRGRYGLNTDHDMMFKEKLERVLREVKILAVLDHPNIVRYYTAWLEIDEQQSDSVFNTLHHNGTSFVSDGHSSSDFNAESESSDCLVRHFSRRNEIKSSIFNKRQIGLSSSTSKLWNDSSMELRSIFDRSSICDFVSEKSDEDTDDHIDDNDSAIGSNFVSKPQHETSKTRDIIHQLSTASEKDSIFDTSQDDDDCVDRDKFNSHNKSTLINNRINSLQSDANVFPEKTNDPAKVTLTKHTLYIQMQLCSQKTIGDYLSSTKSSDKQDQDTPLFATDIPTALRLFLQIAQAVKHVHERGLIHRDLKPQNCFIDEFGTVKVGDFGLSRMSGESREEDDANPDVGVDGAGHTAGVGTQLYASPEQMTGSDYDSSADVFSLGVILFELLYPMNTGMERNIVLNQLRHATFPSDWDIRIGNAFPTIKSLIESMVSFNPSQRPSAASVADHVQSVLSEFTFVSLDQNKHQGPDIILLRVEAQHRPDALGETLKAITDSANDVSVMQYGLRSSSHDEESTAIMEFAIRYAGPASELTQLLLKRPGVHKVRQVSSKAKSNNHSGS